MHEHDRHPLRRCSCLLAAARPAFLPRVRSPAASDPSARPRCMDAGRLRRQRASDGGGYAERPPSDRVAYTAWQEWTQVRPLDRGLWRQRQRLHQPQRRHRAQRAARQPGSATTGEAAAIPTGTAAPSGKPWSGAFVAWVMSRSGISRQRLPARPAGMAGYLAALYDHAAQRRARRAFALHAPNEYAPKPGDLVCTGTAGPTWRYADPRTARRRIDSTAQPLRRRHRRARRLRPGRRRQREEQRDHEPLSRRRSRGHLADAPGKTVDAGGRDSPTQSYLCDWRWQIGAVHSTLPEVMSNVVMSARPPHSASRSEGEAQARHCMKARRARRS